MTPARISVTLAGLALAGAAVLLTQFSSFLDLDVYRWAGQQVFEPAQLYDEQHPEQLLRFTYPPVAAILFAALEPAGALTAALWSIVSLAALARGCVLVARHLPLPRAWQPWHAGLVVMSLTLLLEPAMETLRLGQINFVLLWLVLEGILGPARRGSGALVGLAAALKLTPALFIVMLLVVGRVRDAAVAAGTLAATIAFGFALVPDESRAFWGGALAKAERAGAVEFVANQSINGVLWRLLGEGGNPAAWLVLATACAAACLILARTYWQVGERTVAVGLTGLGAVLASPLSWNHHWTVVMPLLAGLALLPRHRMAVRVVCAACFVVLASRVIWRIPHMQGAEFSYAPFEQVIGAAYVLTGLALLVTAALARPRPGAISPAPRTAGS